MTLRKFAAWLYFWGFLAFVAGVILYISHVPALPDADALEKVTVYVNGIRLEKDFDGTDLVYLRARDDERRFRYQSDFPMYVEMRDRVGINRDFDLWIDPGQEVGRDGAYTIWAFKEHAPRGDGAEVDFETIRAEVDETDDSYWTVLIALGVGGAGLLATGFAIRRFIPYRPEDPHA